MKKYILPIAIAFLASCSNESYEELNQDPNKPTTVSADALFTSATKSLFDQMESTNVNTNVFRLFAQYWTQTTYIDESNYDLVTRSIPDAHWSELYRDVLYDLKDAKSKATSANQIAQIEVLEVYTWQILVDTFGDIPYTEALQGNSIAQPRYDNDTDIYTSLLTRINAAIGTLSTSTSTGFTNSDVIYNGSIAKWKKFANSLKLKLAMRLADVNNSVAKQNAEQAFSSGLFVSNTDNATIHYEANATNANPIWYDLVQSNRNDFVISNTFVTKLNSLNDPRRAAYFEQNLGANTYLGGPYGDNNSYSLFTHINENISAQDFRGVLMDYSEIEFLLAEAKERGYTITGTAEDHYNAGITANMLEWGIAPSTITTYLAQTSVNYTTATGTWRQKIGTQFWIAMYNRGFEGWSVWRKFDTPTLNIPVVSGLPVPTRYTYPIREQNLNGANRTAAAAAIGGDAMTTKVFWDVN